MANSEGGVILIGVGAEQGIAKSLPGVEYTEKEALKLQESLHHGVTPRFNVEISAVRLESGKYVFVIFVKRSRHGPHLVIRSRKFHKRAQFGIEEMDVEQLRRAFQTTRSAEEDAVVAHSARVQEWKKAEGVGIIALLEIYPSALTEERFDPSDEAQLESVRDTLREVGPQTASSRISFDGVCWLPENRHSVPELRFQRSGACLCRWVPNFRNTERLEAVDFLQQVFFFVGRTIETHARLNLASPLHLCLSMLRCKGVTVNYPKSFIHEPQPFDHTSLIFPVLYAEPPHVNETERILDLVAPWAHRLWNAAGQAWCSLYDRKTGKPNWEKFAHERW